MEDSPPTAQAEEPPETGFVPQYEEIAKIAYFIWLSEGRPDGRAGEHWRQAELLHRSEHAVGLRNEHRS